MTFISKGLCNNYQKERGRGGGGAEKPDGGALSKNNLKIEGAQNEITLITGGVANFHFMSCTFNCKNNSTCIVKQEMYSSICSMFLENVNFIYI